MKGVNYIVNSDGERTAVVIEFKSYGEAIEDFLGGLEAEARRDDPTEDFEQVIKRVLAGKTASE